MARYALILIAALVLPRLAGAQAPGGLSSGGGSRGSASVLVTDVVGGAIAGTASSSSVRAETGFLPGLPSVTPVDLRVFHFTVIEEGVGLRWEGNPDLRIFAFRLERAETPGPAPDDDDYVMLDDIFRGGGVHEYLDDQVRAGFTYYYRLLLLAGPDDQRRLGPWSVAITESPRSFTPVIHPAYPNPFREAFVFAVNLAKPSQIGWRLLDVSGRRITAGGVGEVSAGYHAYTVRPRHRLTAGIYFLQVSAGDMIQMQKMVLLP